LDPLQLELHRFGQFHLESAERFVEQQRRRPVDERASQGNALLLASGKLPDSPALEPLELDDAQHLVHARAVRGARHALHLQAEGDVVVDRHVREQRVRLKDYVHRSPVRRDRRDVLTFERDAALIGRDEAGTIRSVVVLPQPTDASRQQKVRSPTGTTAKPPPIAPPDRQIAQTTDRLRH
jgi:hypothetical protein